MMVRLTVTAVDIGLGHRREPVMEPAQRPRRPPVPLTEQRHERGHQQRADHDRVDGDRGRGTHTVLLDEDE